MKLRLFYFMLPAAAIFFSGCLGNKKSVNPGPVPSGSFSGVFRYVRQTSMGQDTGSATLNLTMGTTTGYKITGDTATIHAGSYGSYAIYQGSGQILFQDATFPTSGTPQKIHLSGLYNYAYNGANLQISYSSPQDTVVFYYNFTKN